VKVAHAPGELAGGERAVAIGTFDGVHLGHRRVLEAVRSAGTPATVVTFWPHPRLVLGNRVELLSTLERRLELLDEVGVDETLVVELWQRLRDERAFSSEDELIAQIADDVDETRRARRPV